MWRFYELDCELFATIHNALFGTPAGAILYWIQRAGNVGIAPLLALAIGLAPRGRRAHVAYVLLASVLLAAGFGQALKYVAHAPRPASHLPQAMAPGFWDAPDDGDFARHGHSWPSGHTTAVFAFATAVLLLGAPRRAVVAAFTVAILTGVGRVALGAHFPSDVLAGALVGSVGAWLVARPLVPVELWLRSRLTRGVTVPLVGTPLVAPVPVSAASPPPPSAPPPVV